MQLPFLYPWRARSGSSSARDPLCSVAGVRVVRLDANLTARDEMRESGNCSGEKYVSCYLQTTIFSDDKRETKSITHTPGYR